MEVPGQLYKKENKNKKASTNINMTVKYIHFYSFCLHFASPNSQ